MNTTTLIDSIDADATLRLHSSGTTIDEEGDRKPVAEASAEHVRPSALTKAIWCSCVFQLHREWRWALYIAAMIVGVAILVACIMNADRMEQSQFARFVQARLLSPAKLLH